MDLIIEYGFSIKNYSIYLERVILSKYDNVIFEWDNRFELNELLKIKNVEINESIYYESFINSQFWQTMKLYSKSLSLKEYQKIINLIINSTSDEFREDSCLICKKFNNNFCKSKRKKIDWKEDFKGCKELKK